MAPFLEKLSGLSIFFFLYFSIRTKNPISFSLQLGRQAPTDTFFLLYV